MSNYPTLHVYPSGAWHEDVLLLGNRAALETLQDAIARALESGSAMVEPMTGDGEGYRCFVIQSTDDLALLPMHYTDEVARDRREEASTRLMDVWHSAYEAHVHNR